MSFGISINSYVSSYEHVVKATVYKGTLVHSKQPHPLLPPNTSTPRLRIQAPVPEEGADEDGGDKSLADTGRAQLWWFGIMVRVAMVTNMELGIICNNKCNGNNYKY